MYVTSDVRITFVDSLHKFNAGGCIRIPPSLNLFQSPCRGLSGIGGASASHR